MLIPVNPNYSEHEPYYINENDYINASIIKGSLEHRYKYIAAQGPTKDTILDFIRMLVQFNTKIVICACNEYEGKKVLAFKHFLSKTHMKN
jgi:protein tyrosine phosphatase